MVLKRGAQCAPLAAGAQKQPGLDRVNMYSKVHNYRVQLQVSDRKWVPRATCAKAELPLSASGMSWS